MSRILTLAIISLFILNITHGLANPILETESVLLFEEVKTRDDTSTGLMNSTSRNENNDHPWPMYKGDIRNTGLAIDQTYDNPGRLKWETQINGRIGGGIVVLRDSILVGSRYDYDDGNGLYCLTLNGSVKWKFPVPGVVFHSPAVNIEGDIFFENDEDFYCLFPNGTLKWKINEVGITFSPTIYKNNIYFGNGDGILYSVFQNGTIEWKRKLIGSCYQKPAIDGDILYITSTTTYEEVRLYSIYLNNTENWNISYKGNHRIESPVINSLGEIIIGGSMSGFFCVYPNGTQKWKYNTYDITWFAPSIDKYDNVYCCMQEGYLLSLDSNGEMNWKFWTQANSLGHYDSCKGSPAIDGNGMVYFNCYDDYFYSVDSNGSLKWKYKCGDFSVTSPSIGENGNVYTGFVDKIFSFGILSPDIPRNISTSTDNGKCSLSWEIPIDDGGGDILGYRIYRNLSFNHSKMRKIDEVDSNIMTYTDSSVINGISYSYYLVAYNREGESPIVGPFKLTPKGPATPPRDVATIVGPGYIQLFWKPPLYNGGFLLDTYTVFKKYETGFIKIVTLEPDVLSYVDDDCDPDTEYYYYVVANTDYGEGERSNIVANTTLGIPFPPVNVTLNEYYNAIEFHWDVLSDDENIFEIEFVKIYKSGRLFAKANYKNGTFNLTGLENGVLLFFWLSNVNIIGESETPDQFSGTPGWIPSSPINLSAWADTKQVILEWESPIDNGGFEIDQYSLYRKDESSNWNHISSISSMEYPTFTDNTIEKGKSYEYKIQAINERGPSPYSDPISILVPLGDPPDAPTNVKAIFNYGKIIVTWNYSGDGPDVEEYIILRTNENGSTIKEYTSKKTEFADDSFKWNTTYHYSIIAINDFGESLPSISAHISLPEKDEIDYDKLNNTDSDPDKNKNVYILLVIIIGIITIIVAIIGLFLIIFRNRIFTNEKSINFEKMEISKDLADHERDIPSLSKSLNMKK